MVPGSTTSIALTIGANTVANDPCYGTVVVAWNNATSTATFSNNVLPPVNAGGRSCTIRSGFDPHSGPADSLRPRDSPGSPT